MSFSVIWFSKLFDILCLFKDSLYSVYKYGFIKKLKRTYLTKTVIDVSTIKRLPFWPQEGTVAKQKMIFRLKFNKGLD